MDTVECLWCGIYFVPQERTNFCNPECRYRDGRYIHRMAFITMKQLPFKVEPSFINLNELK